MSLDLEDQEDAGSDITTNLGHNWETVYLFHRLAEGIWQFNEPDWYSLIAKVTGNEWHESKLNNKFYMDHSVKILLICEEAIRVEIGRGVDNGVVCHQFWSTYTANTLLKKLLLDLQTLK